MFVTCKSITKNDQLPAAAETKVVSQSSNDQIKSTNPVKEALMKDNDSSVNLGGECIVYKDVKKIDCPTGGEKVCGCNNKTYANKCEALRHVSWYTLGPCE
jgi:hypothetical protein